MGQIDTSILRNDEYVIRLAVADTDGVVNIVEQNVGVSGGQLGNFLIPFTDLVVPVAGIPIQVTRIYDSLDADIEGDFGFGTRLEFRDTDLRVGLPESGLEDIGIFTAFRPGTRVFLNLPGQGRVGFTFDPLIRVLPGFGGNNLVLAQPRFTADPGVNATLSPGVSGFVNVNEFGDLVAPGNIPFNPASPDFGGAFVVTTDDGLTYRINGATGQLDTATDRNGNTITFTDSGIVSDAIGTVISIERDARGRITSITDPSGESIEYEYSSAGDLIAVTDRLGNRVTYDYDPDRPHFLTSFSDSFGNEIFRNEYDEDGRISRSFDVNGNELELSFDPENRIQEVTDQFGRTTFVEFDLLGNPVTSTDGLGNQTTRTFDGFGNLTSLTDALGNTSTFVVDANGNTTQEIDPLGNVTEFSYNNFNLITSTTDAQGTTTDFQYDGLGNLIAIIDAAGNTSTLVRDQQGNLIEVIDALGQSVVSEFDAAGRLISTTSAEGIAERLTYDANGRITGTAILNSQGEIVSSTSTILDANGNPVSFTDPEGAVTNFEFDERGNLVGQVSPLGVESTTEFFADGTIGSETFAGLTIFDSELDESTGLLNRIEGFDGSVTTFEFDDAGRPTTRFTSDTESDDAPVETNFVYDDAGRLISANIGDEVIFSAEFDANASVTGLTGASDDSSQTASNAIGAPTQLTLGESTIDFTYDDLGRVTEVRGVSDGVFEYEYSALGALTRVSESGKVIFEYEYDGDNRLILSRDGDGFESTFEYNELGLLISATDGNGNTTQYQYDGSGRRTAVIRPDGSSLEDQFDAGGQLVESTNPDGTVLSFDFNDFGQLTGRTDSDGAEVVIEYDEQGRRSRVLEPFGEVTFTYDSESRLIRRDEPDGAFIEYSYTENGRVESTTTPGGTTEYTYDSQDRIATVVQDGELLASYTYDEFGRIDTVVRSNGTTETVSYDQFGLVESTITTDASGNEVFSLVYTRNGRGLITSETRDGETSIEYFYDGRDQLILEQHFIGEELDFEIGYSYDANSNRLVLDDSRSETTFYTYDQNDRLIQTVQGNVTTTFDYDGNGNLILEFVDQQNQTQYDFNSLGRLVEVVQIANGATTTTLYRYNVDGIRVAEIVDGVERRFIFDRNGQLPEVLETYDATGQTLSTTTFGVGLLAENQNGEQRFLHVDDIGSVRFVTDDAGQNNQGVDYSGFGIAVDDLPAGLERGFLGEQTDLSTGLTYLRARYYDASTGRFISPDPIEGDPTQPGTRQDYAYALNDPRNTTDPTGLTTLSEQISVTAVRNTLIGVGLAQGLVSAIGIARGAAIQFDADPTISVSTEFLGIDAEVTLGIFQSAPDPRTNRAGVALTIVFSEGFGRSVSLRETFDRRSRLNEAQSIVDFARLPSGVVQNNDAINAAVQVASLPSSFTSVLASFSFGNSTLFTPDFFGTSGAQLNGAFLSASVSGGFSIGLSGSIVNRLEQTLERLGISVSASLGVSATIQGFGIGFDLMDSGIGASDIQRGNGPDVSFSLEASVGVSIAIPFDEVTVRPSP